MELEELRFDMAKISREKEILNLQNRELLREKHKFAEKLSEKQGNL